MKEKVITLIGVIFIIIGIFIYKLPSTKESKKENINDSVYSYLSLEPKDKNIVYSPISIITAFKMLSEGATKDTKKELDSLFSSYKINNYKTSQDLSFANSIFINEKFKNEIKDEYINLLKEKYNSDVIYDSFETPEIINNWISEKTFKLIKNAINEVRQDTVLALINALAINVKWSKEFDESRTISEKFYLNNGNIIDTLMMHNTYKSNTLYYKDDNISIVNLPLEPILDTNFEFLAIMPNDIDKYIENISKEKIDEISNKLIEASETKELRLTFPKFKYEYELNLMGDLKKIGVKKVFTESAELDGIGKDLYVSNAIHKATIDLSEKGAKASAVTTIIVSKSTAFTEDEYVSIDFNKPFIFIIRDKNTKDVWFIGKVINPNV